MYIRRKVFSIIEDENGEERLFSTTEFVNEEDYLRLFTSTKELIDQAADGDKEAEKKLRRKVGNKVATIGGGIVAIPSAVVGGGLGRNSQRLVKVVGGKNKATAVGGLIGTGAGLITGTLASQKLARAAAKEGVNQEIKQAKKNKNKEN